MQSSGLQSPVVRKLPSLLMSLHKPMYSTMSAHELKDACRDVFSSLKITTEESAYLEESTRLQAQSTLWHHISVRSNHVISVQARVYACKASVINPPKHLVKTIWDHNSIQARYHLCNGIFFMKIRPERRMSKNTMPILSVGMQACMPISNFLTWVHASPNGIIICM